MTDKRKPSYSLKEVKKAALEGRCQLTIGAKQDAHEIGFSETEATDVISKLDPADFYKSTPSYYNSSVWQDVYKVSARGIPVYIKFKGDPSGSTYWVSSFKRDTGSQEGKS
jgi:motility quorum-sensing regulator / GCU-specific mRNA interferase toxin